MGITKQRFRCLALTFLVPLLLCQAVSCGGKTDEKNRNTEQTPPTASVIPARPGIGLGRTMPEKTEANGIIICVDPGHGFMDGGTGDGVLANGLLEKDITLALANKLCENLNSMGYTTVMTHDGVNPPQDAIYDSIFNANERVAYINSITVDYVLSIHVNSSENSDAEGTRIYYMDNSIKVNPIGGVLAQFLSQNIERNMPDETEPMIIDQSKEQISYALCREVKYPSALVEIGFCTNPNDAANMIRDEWQEAYAQSLANGIDEYFTKYAD
ncbi:MAG: N-acetylmuramoyl-L-alanine amidase [Eubacteriales bacterium]